MSGRTTTDATMETLRRQLHELVLEKKSLVDPEVVNLSQLLDRVVLHYYKK
ncbi:aspartyl-phosphate phosphatase Spo0E family protein [Paenibacillus koleovorans]|uniref:aspartyl-phosphate phosphatase Spo0E family protein n=1 Tax=Paenibacillus koleovorans TaxID=121608 RepID=UPI001FE4C2A0|nr:aspartyl-phosphate phosphatase Spo0E family protein [Paenibacillus koleovorans]